jgi:transposase
MFSITAARYYLYRHATDMRKNFDGLCGLVTDGMQRQPMSGDVYIFINKRRTCIKLLRWEAGGYVLFYKRLEQGTLGLGKEGFSGHCQEIQYTELAMLISGIDLKKASFRRRFLPQSFVRK